MRQARRWTRAEAAERLGVQPFTLQRVEEGLELPPDPRKMARVYGVSRLELAAAARRVAGRDFGRISSVGDAIRQKSRGRWGRGIPGDGPTAAPERDGAIKPLPTSHAARQ